MENENELIDFNLKILKDKTEFSRSDFKDLNGKDLMNNFEMQMIFIDLNLVNDIGTGLKLMRLSPFAKNIINEYNGWINYLNKQKEINYRQELKEQLDLENKIAENEKLKHEKDLRQLQIDLANSNIKSNESSVRSIRFSKFIGILTILALITQIVLNQYNESKYKDVKKMEERLQSKTTQLNLYVQKVDSLKTLLSNQNRISQKNTDKLIFSKKD